MHSVWCSMGTETAVEHWLGVASLQNLPWLKVSMQG